MSRTDELVQQAQSYAGGAGLDMRAGTGIPNLDAYAFSKPVPKVSPLSEAVVGGVKGASFAAVASYATHQVGNFINDRAASNLARRIYEDRIQKLDVREITEFDAELGAALKSVKGHFDNPFKGWRPAKVLEDLQKASDLFDSKYSESITQNMTDSRSWFDSAIRELNGVVQASKEYVSTGLQQNVDATYITTQLDRINNTIAEGLGKISTNTSYSMDSANNAHEQVLTMLEKPTKALNDAATALALRVTDHKMTKQDWMMVKLFVGVAALTGAVVGFSKSREKQQDINTLQAAAQTSAIEQIAHVQTENSTKQELASAYMALDNSRPQYVVADKAPQGLMIGDRQAGIVPDEGVKLRDGWAGKEPTNADMAASERLQVKQDLEKLQPSQLG